MQQPMTAAGRRQCTSPIPMNSSEASIVAYITAQRITQSGATQLLQLVRDPAFCALDSRSASWNHWVARLYTMMPGESSVRSYCPRSDQSNYPVQRFEIPRCSPA